MIADLIKKSREHKILHHEDIGVKHLLKFYVTFKINGRNSGKPLFGNFISVVYINYYSSMSIWSHMASEGEFKIYY